MPSIIGNIKITTVGSAGVANFGDTLYISPKSTSKTFAGAGSFTTGDFQLSKQGLSNQLNLDSDLADNITASKT